MSDSARAWAFGIALGVAFFALAWARRRTGVGRRVDVGMAPPDAWAEIAKLRRRELFVICAMWSVVLIVLWGICVQVVDVFMPRSHVVGWMLYAVGGGYLLWSAFAYAVKVGYRFGVVDAATLWQERARREAREAHVP